MNRSVEGTCTLSPESVLFHPFIGKNSCLLVFEWALILHEPQEKHGNMNILDLIGRINQHFLTKQQFLIRILTARSITG